MDVNNVKARLNEIAKEARALVKLLEGGNTGTRFELGLKVIELHAGAIRAQTNDLIRSQIRAEEDAVEAGFYRKEG